MNEQQTLDVLEVASKLQKENNELKVENKFLKAKVNELQETIRFGERGNK